MSTKQAYIAEANRFLVQAGVPKYSEMLAQRDQLVVLLKLARNALGWGDTQLARETVRKQITDIITEVGAA